MRAIENQIWLKYWITHDPLGLEMQVTDQFRITNHKFHQIHSQLAQFIHPMHISNTKLIPINHKIKCGKTNYRSRIETWKMAVDLRIRNTDIKPTTQFISQTNNLGGKKKGFPMKSRQLQQSTNQTCGKWGSRFTCELGSGPLALSLLRVRYFCEQGRAGRTSYIRNACPNLPLGFPKRTVQSRVLAVEVDLSDTFSLFIQKFRI